MNEGPLRVLLVEDSASDAKLIARELNRKEHTPCLVTRVEDEPSFREQLTHPCDVVIADYRLPHFSAPAVLQILKEVRPDLPCVIVSGAIGGDTAAGALKLGAIDFVAKDRLWRLPHAVRNAREVKEGELAEINLRETRHQSELLSTRMHELEARRRIALELNDAAVQRLVVAQAALSHGDLATVEIELATAMAGLHEVLSRLLPPTVAPGALRRTG